VRLGTLFLIASALAAQETPGLPWDRVPNLPWRSTQAGTIPPAPPSPAPASTGPLRLNLDADGALRIVDGRGIIRLRTGLPGRPQKLWRDGGTPLQGASGSWTFPAETPICRGIGALPLGRPDFRPGLEGLLWVMDDEERILTVLHPATSRVVYLPLPAGNGLDLVFLPDQLMVRQGGEGSDAPPSRSAWSLPWLNLLPQFILLGTPLPAPPPGTAMLPFPKE